MQSRLVSAILLGTSIPVPKGKDVGGAFKKIPLCRTARPDRLPDQLRVVPIDAAAAGQHALRPRPGDGMESACTNPAALGGGSGELHAYLTGAGSLIASGAPQKHQWVQSGAPIDTPFVSVPGLLTSKCATNENGSYLELTVNGDPADPRADDIPGDLGMLGRVQANWGMHLVDVNVAMGNLVDIVGSTVEGVSGEEGQVGQASSGAGECQVRAMRELLQEAFDAQSRLRVCVHLALLVDVSAPGAAQPAGAAKNDYTKPRVVALPARAAPTMRARSIRRRRSSRRRAA